jgi:hypothetical protein
MGVYLTDDSNSFCERFIGSLRRECLDFFLIVHQKQLHNLVKAYQTYYNQQRPHQGIEQRIPARFNAPSQSLSNQAKSKVISTPVLHGLHHTYAYAGAIQ